MAEEQSKSHSVSGSSIFYATLAAIAVGGPLLGMMGFSLLASFIILLISSPFLFISSPFLIPAGFVLAGAILAFGTAGTMALAGISSFAWIFRCVRREPAPVGFDELDEVQAMLTESGQKVKEQVGEWDGKMQRKIEVLPAENKNRS